MVVVFNLIFFFEFSDSQVYQTGTILVPDPVTTILNLMTGMGLLAVAAAVRAA
jgi:hypothetical protein